MRSIFAFFQILFSPIMLIMFVYILLGIFTNTAPPHLPQGGSDIGADAHSWIQYSISILGWPLGHWNPTFTFGKWTP